MTAREKVLKAYGGKCRWCSSPGPLEIDHTFNDGARDARTVGIVAA